jgi:hypothetical protein
MRRPDQAAGDVVLHPDRQFNGVKVFSATLFAERAQLGHSLTEWLVARPQIKVTQLVVTQSSDAPFHCVAITVFYWEPVARSLGTATG